MKTNKAETQLGYENRAWHRFIDSMMLLGDKVHPPDSRLAGEPVAQDNDGIIWSAIVLFGKADGEQAVRWGLKNHTDPDEVCGYCMGNRTTRPYTDLRETANWLPSEIGSTQPMLARLSQPHHPLVDAPFFTFWFFRMDIMHLLDCKGVWAILMGSALWMLVHDERRLGSNQELRMNKIDKMKLQFYKAHKVKNRMPNIKVNNLHDAQGFAKSEWASNQSC